MQYSFEKTVKKGAIPIIFIVIVRALIAAMEQAGMKIIETDILTIAIAGYGALIAVINWLKNRNKKS